MNENIQTEVPMVSERHTYREKDTISKFISYFRIERNIILWEEENLETHILMEM